MSSMPSEPDNLVCLLKEDSNKFCLNREKDSQGYIKFIWRILVE
jgi:hypothetical protein